MAKIRTKTKPVDGAALCLDDIRAAAAMIGDTIPPTPLVHSQVLSQQAGCDIWLKLENLRFTGSFKDRGALVKLTSLSKAERRAGVIAMSAGNHAQGVAFNARHLGIPATIVMPMGTSFTKIRGTETLGAEVVLAGESLADAAEHAERLQKERGLTFVHPYDDPNIIAGQGTIALEILDLEPDIDQIIVPIGGGGLISGIAVAGKAIAPDIGIIGVETKLYPSMYQALRGDTPTSGGQTIADGIAVKNPGNLTKAIIKRLVDDIILVDETEIEHAVQRYIEIEKIAVEGAGAVALAAVFAEADRFAGKRVAVIVSGGNIDARVLASILMRGLVRDGRLVRLRVEISDAPGALAKVAQLIGEHRGNIVEIYHQRLFQDVPVKLTDLDVVLETRNREHVEEIVTALRQAGFETRHLSNMAAGDGN